MCRRFCKNPHPRRALIDTLATVRRRTATRRRPIASMRVLAAEDNKTNRLVFSKMLKAST